MIGGSERLVEASCAVLSDREQTVCQAVAMGATKAVEALTERYGHGRCHAFPGQPCQFLSQSMRFLVFDVQAHIDTFLPDEWNHSTLVTDVLASLGAMRLTGGAPFWSTAPGARRHPADPSSH